MSLELLFQQAIGFHQSGNLAKAEQTYRKILAAEPTNFTVRHMLGVLRFQQGHNAEALDLIGRALQENPPTADALSNYGLVLHAAGRLDDALASFDKAIAINPRYAEALYNRGITLQGLTRSAEALKSFDRALGINPQYADALYNRGNILRDLRCFRDALASVDLALALKPTFPFALNSRGNILRDLKRFDEALKSYDRALTIQPDYVEALVNRGKLLWSEYRLYDPAVRDLERAISIDPDFDYARGYLVHLRMHGGDWRDIEQELALLDGGVRAGRRVVEPFVYQALSDRPIDLQACAVIYAKDRYPSNIVLAPKRVRHRARIRVGYVSGEFREHATAYLMAGLFELHDHEKFEIFAFDNGWNDNKTTRKRLEISFDKFIDIANLSDRAAAERIVAEEIDILVNLNGYFGLQRMGIFAHKPAPIQLNYLGFPGTLGAGYMDYVLADRIVIPEDDQQFYNEKIVYLPDCYQANDSRRRIVQNTFSRSDCGLPENGFVFCSFNQSYKLTPSMFAVWTRLLRQVEGSVLWISQSNATFSENLKGQAESHGIAAERLIFAPHVAMESHLARMSLADLFLDSVPCNAHTTASDALWAGLPLITCCGNAFSGRVATSILHAIGLPELATNTLRDYEALALKLARDAGYLRSIRTELKQNLVTHSLFDTDRFRRHLEVIYSRMYEIWRAGESPRGFSVSDA